MIAAASTLPLAVLTPLMAAPAAHAAAQTTLYASPSAGSGAACTQADPCTLPDAQAAVRGFLADNQGADVTVLLADGTYRPSSTWAFTAADSGSAGHPVVWRAAPGARPVISGASQIGGWTQVGSSAVWSAPVPTGSNSRQLYVNGQETPVAQAKPSSLGWSDAWTGSPTGYTISKDTGALEWFRKLTPDQISAVEFDYPGANGGWTESRCRVKSFDAGPGTLTMQQPCWEMLTERPEFSSASGSLPPMNSNTAPSRVENAQALLGPGQWFLDSASTPNTLYYVPPSGTMAGLDVELPRLESLLTGSGTLSAPIHDLTFSGLQFSYATWNDPSTNVGFVEVQSNLRTTTAKNQGMCGFSDPAGSCPWGSLTQPLANVTFSGAANITLRGNRFSELGGAGLSVKYGSNNTVIDGNEFTDIASIGVLLGCTYDPEPEKPELAEGIRKNCTVDPSAVTGDSIGANEILTDTTVSNNIVHHVGTDYSSAPGIAQLFSRHTTITRNTLYDMPYTAITTGIIQGHVNKYVVDPANPNDPEPPSTQNSKNINAYNTVSNNVIHDFMKQRGDGAAIYTEGHQAQYVRNPDGTLDSPATLATGLQVIGNIAYDNNGNGPVTLYNDAGSEWVNMKGNVAFATHDVRAQGGCNPTGHLWITDNYFSGTVEGYGPGCTAHVTDSNASGNTTIVDRPGPGVIPDSVLGAAGSTAVGSWPASDRVPDISYRAQNSTATEALVAVEGFTDAMPVYVKGSVVSGVTRLSGGFLIVPLSGGATASDISLGGATRIGDNDGSITYSGFSYAENRPYGDHDGDAHVATADGSTATLRFTGTGIQVFGEQNPDQGNIGVSRRLPHPRWIANRYDPHQRHRWVDHLQRILLRGEPPVRRPRRRRPLRHGRRVDRDAQVHRHGYPGVR
ncbi:right-handed parallel beta-helix repeat-containing protein [Streptomyces sp. NRRL WC-3742]|uniref:right-handed parallel beta-helix repeat-containing protein n=1 Tax=Streptomyces sp. NRRL WC-3742 TaxID=1463934 RepID=UPI0004C96892|nr:right-handed parallel beta-helix repeat-containing protein [Streptomyces sp. NRRL WC-3742]